MKKNFIPVLISIIVVLAGPLKAAVCEDWDLLDKQVRDGRMDRATARKEIIALDQELLADYAGKITAGKFYFPLEGYSSAHYNCVLKGDYQPGGYDFYQGNKHGGHPAYDLFIADKDEDLD